MNFTAIDFETANEQHNSVCSVGIAVVRNGVITEQKEFLVKPQELRFNPINISIHGITVETVKNAPTFPEVWKELKQYIENQVLLAHNTNFDIPVLEAMLMTYNIEVPNFRHLCTLELSRQYFPNLGRYKLSDVAQLLGIQLRHHNALSDAYAAAQIGLTAWKIENNLLDNYQELYSKTIEISETPDYFSVLTETKRINSSLLKPDLENTNTESYFYNKRVVFTGDLESMTRSEASEIIFKMGADINTAISRKTNIVIIGYNPGPSKMRQIEKLLNNGIEIDVINENRFLDLINH